MKTLLNLLLKISFAAVFAASGPAMAAGIDLIGDDTDLFTTNPNIPAQVPNVLIIVDNTSSWDRNNNGWSGNLDPACTTPPSPPYTAMTGGKQGDAELCAIFLETSKLTQGVNVGFMMFNATNQGSYVRYSMKPMTPTNITSFGQLLTGMNISAPANKVGTNSYYEDKMNDVFRYFNSLQTYIPGASTSSPADATGYTGAAMNNFQFIQGQAGDTCGYDYVIFIGNGFPNTPAWTANPPSGAAADLVTAAALLNDPTNVTFGTNNADLVPLQNTGSNADLWAKFMFKYGVKIANGAYRHITTYTINVCQYSATGADTCPTTLPGGASQTTLLDSMATVSQGKPFRASNLAGIQMALAQIFAEVQAVNSVFAATTLPVSINVRGTNLNQVYIGVFRPDALSSPRWLGNLKQYQLGVNGVTGALQLIDSTNAAAVNLNTGFITNSATSFWTTIYDADPNTTGTQGFWSFRSPNYAPTDVGRDQDAPDGDLVEKGGAAEMIRKTYPIPDSTGQVRNIFTCTGTCTAGGVPLSSTPFDATNVDVTSTLLGTYATFNVSSLTASGTTATATMSPLNTFASGATVTIAGAIPNLFNGNYTISIPTDPITFLPSTTKFTYTLSSSPDTTHAYVTLPAYKLTPGKDLITVSGSTPSAYDVANAAITTVSTSQFSYAITGTPTPTTSDSGYTVTGVRQVQSSAGPSQMSWKNDTGLVTVNLPNHGYTGGNIIVTGATDPAFNVNGAPMTITGPSQFTYSPSTIPAGGSTTTGIVQLPAGQTLPWGNGTQVLISGATGVAPNTNYNTLAAGATVQQATQATGTFQYATNGAVSAPAVGSMVANRIVVGDTSTWTITSSAYTTGAVNQTSAWNVTAVAISSSNSTNLRFSLNQAKLAGSGVALRSLATGDTITVSASGGCTYQTGNGAANRHNCVGTFTVVGVANGDTANIGGSTPGSSYTNLSSSSLTVDVSQTFGTITAINSNSPSPVNSNGNAAGGPYATMTYGGGAPNSSGINNLPNSVVLTLNYGQYTGQFLRRLAVNDQIIVNNCTFATATGSSNCTVQTPSQVPATITAVSGNSDVTSTPSPLPANTYGTLSGTVQVTIVPSGISAANTASPTTTATPTPPVAPANTLPAGATTVVWTGTSTGPSITLATVVPGPLTVPASGTIYASKTGDLTSQVTSITNQSVATGSITAGLATVPDPNERANLIAWVRGVDNKEDENRNGDSTDVRASVHGDVLHSRPAVVNYNRTPGNNDIMVFYGANDGMLHAVKGGQASGGGQEQWAFIAPEHFGKLKRLRNQSPSISSANPKDYFFDGPIGVYTRDDDGGGQLTSGGNDKVYLFVAMRRGGRMIYAFDVTDPTAPKLLWKKGCTQPTGTGAAGGCDTGWDQIGQTWSQPQVVYLRAYANPVLIFGAGYDPYVEDFQPCFITSYSATSVTAQQGATVPTPMSAANCPPSSGTSTTVNRTMGRGVFIVDSRNGTVLKRIGPDAGADIVVPGMTYAMNADLAILRNRSNTASRGGVAVENVPTGFMDRIYAPDTGGNVWRIDVADAAPGNWVVSQLASVAASTVTSTTLGTPAAASMRKFEFQPDVVYSSDANGLQYDAVLLGSGDREHPFDMTVANRFYMFKDRNVGTISPSATVPAAITESNLFDVTDGCLQAAANCPAGVTQAQAQTSLDAASGWKLQLANTGEKTISSATTAASTVIFNTNQPKEDTVTGVAQNVGSNSANQCVSDLGTARQYGINFQNGNSQNIFSTLPTQYVPTAGQGRYATFAGGGFLPTPVPVVVQIGGKYYQTVIAGVQTTNPGGLKLQSRLRTYWYRKTD